MYTYRAIVIKVIDGDTVDLNIDLGFHISVSKRIRLSLIDASEMNTDAGKQAKQFVSDKLSEGKSVIVQTKLDSSDKYGRILGEIFLDDSISSINKMLIDAGLAEIYKG